MKKYKWVGPFEVRSILEHATDGKFPFPQKDKGAYVVSKSSWTSVPDPACIPLYVGGTTGKSARFRIRIGDLIADLFGFFNGKGAGHHSGGQSLHAWCKKENVDPLSLHIAWVKNVHCHRCLENELFVALSPKLCKKSPPHCKVHVAV